MTPVIDPVPEGALRVAQQRSSPENLANGIAASAHALVEPWSSQAPVN